VDRWAQYRNHLHKFKFILYSKNHYKMSKENQVKAILSQIKKLDYETRIELMEELVDLLKRIKLNKKASEQLA
jgi:hypothetical protein